MNKFSCDRFVSDMFRKVQQVDFANSASCVENSHSCVKVARVQKMEKRRRLVIE